MLRVRLQQILRHRRHQRARQDERPDHREHHRFGHRHEQKARDACAGRTSARTRCRCTAARRRPASRSGWRRPGSRSRPSLPCSRCQLMFSMVTVASSTRMPTASARPPSVMMLRVSPSADSIDDRAEHGQRDRGGDDHGRAPAAEEQQDHQAGQQRGDDAFAATPLMAPRTNIDWSPMKPILSAVRQRVLDVDDLLLDAGDDSQRRDRAGLQHRHQHRAVAVDVHDVGLRRIAVAHTARRRGHRPWRRSTRLDRQVAEFLDLRAARC